MLARLGDPESLQHRLTELEKLDETCADAVLNMESILKRRKSYYESKLKLQEFKTNGWGLLHDNPFIKFPGTFQFRWLGP